MSTQYAIVPPPEGSPAMARTVESRASPAMPTKASVLKIHLGSLGSTRYQCPRAISPVTPPRARAAEIAGAHPPAEAWISKASPANGLEDPRELPVSGNDQSEDEEDEAESSPPWILCEETDHSDHGGDRSDQPGEAGADHPGQGDRCRDQGQTGGPCHQHELGLDQRGQVVGHGRGSYGALIGAVADRAATRNPRIGNHTGI